MIRKAAVVVALATVAALVGTGNAAAFSRETVTIESADGIKLAATLTVPAGAAPASGWPAVIFLHGLGGSRADMVQVAEQMGVIGERYVVLAYDARGHGESGGLITIDGPKEIADVKAAFALLRDRPDVTDDRIGAFGISYGGAAAWNSLAAGVPWATIEVVETWTDLRTALIPQGLVKSGVIAGFIGPLDPAKIDPEVITIRDAAFAGQIGGILPWAATRSSLAALKGVKTPVFMMQGRRDFAFGLDQALQAWRQLAGPKRLWFGLHGHAPSTFPTRDSPVMLAEAARWFDRYLRGAPGGIDMNHPVAVSPERWRGKPTRYSALPATMTSAFALPGTSSMTAAGKVVREAGKVPGPFEVFGTPSVRVTATAAGGWSRLVAVLSARTPGGKEIVVAGGGVPVAKGKKTYTISLSSQATYVPPGSKLTVTFGSSSLAQNPGNLLYLDLPMAPGARVAVGPATLRVPALAKPISR
jgi:pimeloyl-ACP methyl ester carboxylesterase